MIFIIIIMSILVLDSAAHRSAAVYSQPKRDHTVYIEDDENDEYSQIGD